MDVWSGWGESGETGSGLVSGFGGLRGKRSANLSDEEYLRGIEEFLCPKVWTWVLIFANFLVFCVGLVGNGLVILAVFRNRKLRSFTNFLIGNLAFADFLVLIFCLPPSVIWDVTLTWFFGTAICKIVLYLQTVSVTVSILTLTFIAIDRWHAINAPLQFKSTSRRAKTAVIVIWIISLLFDIPELVVYEAKANENLRIQTIYFTECAPNWTLETDRNWTITKLVLLYLLPLAFMSYTYSKIIKALWKSGKLRCGDGKSCDLGMESNVSMQQQLRSRRNAAKMLVSVVGMFAFCYFPVHLLSVLRLTVGLRNSDVNRAFALVSHWLCYVNSAVNPVIYNFMSSNFRAEFYRSVRMCSCGTKAKRQRAAFSLIRQKGRSGQERDTTKSFLDTGQA